MGDVKSVASSVGAEVRNPKWTSYGSLEVDVFVPSVADMDLLLSLEEPLHAIEFSHDLSAAPSYKPEEEVFAEARALFNSERYWECHEALEGIWRQKAGSEKLFLQGLILVCAAYVHHQKGEDNVAMSVLKRASEQLSYPAPRYGGVDVANLDREVAGAIESGALRPFKV